MKLEYRLKNNMLELLNTLLDKEIDEETKKSYTIIKWRNIN